MAGSSWERVYKMAFASVYPQYIPKVEAKGRTRAEVDEVIRWLTGYTQERLEADRGGDGLRDLLRRSAQAESRASEIKGVICGLRVEEIEEPSCARSATSTSSSTSWPGGKRWRRC